MDGFVEEKWKIYLEWTIVFRKLRKIMLEHPHDNSTIFEAEAYSGDDVMFTLLSFIIMFTIDNWLNRRN